jgi:hypothetical protein
VNCANAPPGRLIPKRYSFLSNKLIRYWSGDRKRSGRHGRANRGTPRFPVTEPGKLEPGSIVNFAPKRESNSPLVKQDWPRCHRPGGNSR